MKELLFILKVLLFSIALFVYGYSSIFPIDLSIPVEWNLKLDLSLPVLFVMLASYLSLVWYPLRYNEPFVKPYKGYDKNFKMVAFNPAPLLTAYFGFLAILSANKSVGLGTFFYLLAGYFFFRICHRRGFSIIQSWYEDAEGKVIYVLLR